MKEFIKFICVGVLNTALDFAVLNALLFIFGAGENASLYVIFKSISFLAAVTNSFFFNKYWVFAKQSAPESRESVLFFSVSMLGFLVNVGVSFVAFSVLTSVFEIPLYRAANFGALTATGAVFLSNYAGYKFIVFRKHHG